MQAASQQYALWGTGSIPIVHDAEGGICYWPQVLSQAEQQACFAALKDGIAWRSEERPMYERMVMVPRLVARVALADVRTQSPAVATAVGLLHEAVNDICSDASFTHMGLNFYRNGQDSVSMHGDKIHQLQRGHCIAIVSLGAARTMLIKSLAPHARALRLVLAPGSVLVMSYASQTTHEHGIPKTVQAAGPRISCAFRARLARD